MALPEVPRRPESLRQQLARCLAQQEHCRMLFESILEGVGLAEIILDDSGEPHDFRMVEVNPAFRRMTGLPPEVPDERTMGALAPDLADLWTAAFGQVALTGEAARFDSHVERLGRWFEVFAFRTGPLCFAQLLIDITERKLSAQGLAREQELLRSILDAIPVMITIYDPALRTFRVNREFERVLGWSQEDASHIDLLAAVYPDLPERQEAREYMTALEPGWREFLATAKDGSTVQSCWSNIRLSDRTRVGIGIDLRERRDAEATRVREQAFRTLAENSPDVIARFDRNLRRIYANRAIEAYVGRPREEILGKTNHELGVPEELAGFWDDNLRQVFDSGSEQWMETTMPTPRGHRELESRLVPELAEDGTVETVLGITRDITDRRAAEARLRQLGEALETRNRELEEANRRLRATNEELQQFSSVVSHDLKAPLRAIHSLSSIIEEDLGDRLPDPVRTNMKLLRNRVRRMDDLINALLEYARAGGDIDRIQDIDVAAMVADIVNNYTLPPGFSIHIPRDLPRFSTAHFRLQQVFANLIENAIKYHHRPDGHLRISCSQTGTLYEFTVADDGPGIPPEFAPTVFLMFQRGPGTSQVSGTGIGLAVVKKAVESVGGNVMLESEPGKGTTVRFTWPRELPLDDT